MWNTNRFFALSTLNHGNRSQFYALFTYARLVTSVNHIRDIFVRLWRLCQTRIWHYSKPINTMLYSTSSITNFGDATRIDMPWAANLSSTSWKSIFRRDFARDNARPWDFRFVFSFVYRLILKHQCTAPWQVVPKVVFMPFSVPVKT